MRKRLFRKGIDIFLKLGTLLINRNSQSADLCKQAFFLENRFFWYVCLLMIISIDTVMCGEQIVLFFGQETVVVVETHEILLFIFFKKGLLLLTKHFETSMTMLTKNV